MSKKRQVMTEEDLRKKGLIETSPGVFEQVKHNHLKTALEKTENNNPGIRSLINNDPQPTYKPGLVTMSYLEEINDQIDSDDLKTAEQVWFGINRTITFPIIPLPKPRMTGGDRWKKRPVVMRYREYADLLRKLAAQEKYMLGEELVVTFYLPIPKSKLKKIKEGDKHHQKPDIDNLSKGVMDILTSERYELHNKKGDQHVYSLIAKKFYSANPRIEIDE